MHAAPWALMGAALASTLVAQEPPAALLARVGDYVAAYERRFSVLVAEEHYVQTIDDAPLVNPAAAAFGRDGTGSPFSRGEGKRQTRTLRSDYLLVTLPGGGWLPFRDVYDVNGSPVRDRTDRLAKLFLTDAGLARPAAAAAFEQARSIMAESARHNIGDVQRNVNLPTLALLFAAAENQPRFEYRVSSDGAAPVLHFTEQQRPTLIRTTNGRDLPVRGRLWIDEDAAITQTEMIATDAQLFATIEVVYEASATLGMRVPARMTERYEVRGRSTAVSGIAIYSRFRRFQVSTTEKLGRDCDGRPQS